MTEITRAYEFVVMAAGSTSTADLTFTDNDFVRIPEYATPTVDIFEARAESQPFDVEILDTSEQVTAALSDANGRADLMGRFWRLRVNEDGGGLTTVAQGRVVGIRMSATLGSYVFLCGDEFYLMRNHDLFEDVGSTPTTQIWPPGLRSDWMGFRAASEAEMEVVSTDTSRSDSKKAVHVIANIGTRYDLSPSVIEWIKDDLKANVVPGSTGTTTGHFTHLRFRSSSTDYEVLSFNVDDDSNDIFGQLDDADADGARRILDMWIAWDTSQPTEGDFIEGVLYAPNAPVSEVLPYHIGGTAGVDLFDELKDRLDDASIEYDSNAFSAWDASTNPNGLLSRPGIPHGHLRITESLTLQEYARRLMKTFLVAPFVNATGQFYPRPIGLPFGITVSGLTEITSSAFTADGHPTFHQTGTAVKTVYKARSQRFRSVFINGRESDWPADRIIARWAPLPVQEHDRVSELGRHAHEVDLWGVGGGFFIEQQKEELFDRFGDGPIVGVWRGLSAVDSVVQGDFVRLTLSSYPDIASQAKGGTRLVQVLSIEKGANGARMEYLDAGSDDNALTTPGIAIIKNSSRPKHDVDVTISSMPAAATGYVVEIKVGSKHWEFGATGTANETITLTNYPSNTAIQARVAATAPGRTRSAWSTAASVTLDALTAPSSVVATISGRSAVITWTNGEALLRPEILIDGVWDGKLWKAGTTRVVKNGLPASTSVDFGVRHSDGYGGVSATTTDTETTGTASTITKPYIVVNRQYVNVDTFPVDTSYGSGIEVGIVRGDPFAKTHIQVDTSDSFSSPDSYFFEDKDYARIHLPLDGATRYVRSRHRLDGFTASAWTDTLSLVPAPFQTALPASPADSRVKVKYLDAAGFTQVDGATTDFIHQIQYLSPSSTSARAFVTGFTLPVGSEITQIRSRLYFVNTGSSIQVVLYQNDGDLTTSSSALANSTQTGTTGNLWLTDSVTHTVAADESFRVFVNITNSSAGNDARFGFCEVQYTSPSSLIVE